MGALQLATHPGGLLSAKNTFVMRLQNTKPYGLKIQFFLKFFPRYAWKFKFSHRSPSKKYMFYMNFIDFHFKELKVKTIRTLFLHNHIDLYI